jgi:hypothetical protein
MVPTWLSSRAFGDPPAQGFRGGPRLPMIVPDVFDLGAASATPQDDFCAIADQHHKETYRNFSCTAITAAPQVVEEVAPVAASAQSDPCWIEIRLRKSTSHDPSITAGAIPVPLRKLSPSRPRPLATHSVRSLGPPLPATQRQ